MLNAPNPQNLTLAQVFRSGFILSGQIFRQIPVPLAIYFMFSALTQYQLSEMMNDLGPKDESMRILLSLVSTLEGVGQFILEFLLLSYGVIKTQQLSGPLTPAIPWGRSFYLTFLAEYLRYLAQILLYLLFFILPGIYRHARLLFMPYVVVFDGLYKDNKRDALKHSLLLSQGQMHRLLPLTILGLSLQLALELAIYTNETLNMLIPQLLIRLLSFLIGVLFFSSYFSFFAIRSGQVEQDQSQNKER